MHEGWAVRISGNRIDAAGPADGVSAPAAEVVELTGTTLLPGLIEGHSHVLLHPYNEASWNDQVLKESLGLRTARAVNHLRATLHGGVHDHPRSRHGRGRLRGCRAEAGGRGADRSRAAHAGDHEGDRRDRQLRAQGICARLACSAGRRGSGRPGAGAGGARPDWPWSGLDQGLRRLPLGRARRGGADVLGRRAADDRRDGAQQRASSRGARQHT